MIVSEVAHVAGVPRETLRAWLKKDGLFDFDRPDRTWKKFSDFETLLIAIYAALVRQTQDYDLAHVGMLLCGKLLMEEWREDEIGTPYFEESTFERDRLMIFSRGKNERWSCDIADAGDDFNSLINKGLSESYNVAPAFTVANLGAIMRIVLIKLLKVQVGMIDANAAEAPK